MNQIAVEFINVSILGATLGDISHLSSTRIGTGETFAPLFIAGSEGTLVCVFHRAGSRETDGLLGFSVEKCLRGRQRGRTCLHATCCKSQ
jgi:hypothetical protein